MEPEKTLHPWKRKKSSEPNHHDFRFELLIFGGVPYFTNIGFPEIRETPFPLLNHHLGGKSVPNDGRYNLAGSHPLHFSSQKYVQNRKKTSKFLKIAIIHFIFSILRSPEKKKNRLNSNWIPTSHWCVKRLQQLPETLTFLGSKHVPK